MINLPEIVHFEEEATTERLTTPGEEDGLRMVFSASTPVLDILPPPTENLLAQQPPATTQKVPLLHTKKLKKVRRKKKRPSTAQGIKMTKKQFKFKVPSSCAAAMLCVKSKHPSYHDDQKFLYNVHEGW